MKILVANLGSTSFKYRLFDMDDERQIARGAVERIGSGSSSSQVEIGEWTDEQTLDIADHAAAVRQCLAQLTDARHGCLKSANEVSAIGFKAVHGGAISGVQRVTPEVLAAMEEMNSVAPAHNPPYIEAMRTLRRQLPEMPLVAAFETDFHQTIPDRNRYYAVPYEWAAECLVQKWGFHGASHRYIATRTAQLLRRDDLRIISCHLGGSSSVSAVRDGKSLANSFGMSAQSGLPHNNRVGQFDPFAIPVIMKRTGKTHEQVLAILAGQSGLAGLSGVGGDLRDIAAAAGQGNARAKLAIDVLATAVRHYIGAYMVELGGVDALVFTGGIGENRPAFRQQVCQNLEPFGIVLDADANASASGEGPIHAEESRSQIWIVPTNEELIVARQTRDVLEGDTLCSSPR